MMSNMRPETRYAKSGTVSIAYQVVGDGPCDLLMAPGFVSHVEVAWEELIQAAAANALILRASGSDRRFPAATTSSSSGAIRSLPGCAAVRRAEERLGRRSRGVRNPRSPYAAVGRLP
jgi:hypothetical protein